MMHTYICSARFVVDATGNNKQRDVVAGVCINQDSSRRPEGLTTRHGRMRNVTPLRVLRWIPMSCFASVYFD